jgi:hypothetical protein
VFTVNISASVTQPFRQVNPQLLLATIIVDVVRRDIQSLVPQALPTGSVTVSETRIRQWQSGLQTAVSLLERIPAPLIFPPPEFVTLINAAVTQINQALAILAAIPIAAPAIFPPVPGQATLSVATLQALLNNLQQAEILLIRAIQAA